MSRQQISWRPFLQSWTRQSSSILELLYKIIINICIVTCIEGRVFVILLFWFALFVQRFVYLSAAVLIYTYFKSSLLAISTRYTQTRVSEVHVRNYWSNLCKMLGTLTTIATPRCSEGVGMFGDVGLLLGPLFIVIFYAYDSDLFYVIAVHTFCDYACSGSGELGACQILRLNRLSTCVDAHWFRLHRIWIRLCHIFM